MDNLAYEKLLQQEGYQRIAGLDEAGRGALAGPLVVAAVVLPKDYYHPLIDDSKRLSDKQRRELFKIIQQDALDYAVVVISMEEIDRLNIYQATKIGMARALEKLKAYDAILSDAMPLPELGKRCISLIQGDHLSLTIAAASILAKVSRDDLMLAYAKDYPVYDFIHNKGYGTKKHMQALQTHGFSALHRKSFEPVKSLLRPTLDL